MVFEWKDLKKKKLKNCGCGGGRLGKKTKFASNKFWSV